jgi:hypothetical protein
VVVVDFGFQDDAGFAGVAAHLVAAPVGGVGGGVQGLAAAGAFLAFFLGQGQEEVAVFVAPERFGGGERAGQSAVFVVVVFGGGGGFSAK